MILFQQAELLSEYFPKLERPHLADYTRNHTRNEDDFQEVD